MKIPSEIPPLPARAVDAHKGQMGRLLIIGGCPGLTGAVTLAARAALRGGAGLVTCAVPASLNPIIEVKLTEAMSLPLPDGGHGHLTDAAGSALVEALANASAAVIGVGIGRDEATTELLGKLLTQIAVPHVIDADGLWHLAQLPETLAAGQPARVLTPHDGEWQRLLGAIGNKATATDADEDFAAATPGVLVRKGPGTRVLAGPRRYQNVTGNPGLATGGTGDVLAGLIGAFLARGDQPWDAAVRAVWLHGRAADLAAAELGEESLIAGDVIHFLPAAIREVVAPRE